MELLECTISTATVIYTPHTEHELYTQPRVKNRLRNKNNNIPFAIPKEKSRDGLYLTIAALVLTIPQAKYIIPFIVITRILQNTHTPKIIRPLGKTTELEDIKAIQAKLLQKSKAEAFFSTSEISEFLRGFQTQADELILAISEEVRTIGTALSPSLFKISIVDSQNVVSAAKKNVQARDQSKPSTTVPPVFQVTSTIEKTTTPIQNQIPNKIIPTSLMSRLFPANKFPNEPIVRAFLSGKLSVTY